MRDGQMIIGQSRHSPASNEFADVHAAEPLRLRVPTPSRLGSALLFALPVGAMLLVGCQHDSARSMFAAEFVGGRADTIWVDDEQSAVILAGVFDEPTSRPDATTQPNGTPSSQPVETTSRPAPGMRKRPYTRPRAVQQAAFLAVVAASMGASEPSDSRTGYEASENVLGRSELRGATQVFGPSGAMNVSLMQGAVIAQSVSRPGLQQGAPLTGALPFNIFSPARNTIGQRCPELVTAGFFSDNASCRNHFQP